MNSRWWYGLVVIVAAVLTARRADCCTAPVIIVAFAYDVDYQGDEPVTPSQEGRSDAKQKVPERPTPAPPTAAERQPPAVRFVSPVDSNCEGCGCSDEACEADACWECDCCDECCCDCP